MDRAEILIQLSRLDGSGSSEHIRAAKVLVREVGEQLPIYLLEKYRTAKRASERCACVSLATRFSRGSDAAFDLGLMALQDRSKRVRYSACSLLAYSLRGKAVPALQGAVEQETVLELVESAKAAIDAIISANHHYFMDRNHSGKLFWHLD